MDNFSLTKEEHATLSIQTGADPEPVCIWHLSDSNVGFVIPLRFQNELQSSIHDYISQIAELLHELPNPDSFANVIFVPASASTTPERCSCVLLRRTSGIDLQIIAPYNGVSLRMDIFDAWAESEEFNSPINFYLFGLACSLQSILGERSQTFTNNSLLWQDMLRSMLMEQYSESDLSERPLLSLITLETIISTAGLHGKVALKNKMLYYKSLVEKRLDNLFKKLVDLANDRFQANLQQNAAKLLIHLAPVEMLEQVSAIEKLDLAGEPVGETVLQRLKYIQSLHSIDLSDTYFPSEALRHLVHLPMLKVLLLINTLTHNNAIIHLCKSRSIEVMDCAATLISDEGAKHFMSFPRLKSVDLSRTSVSPGMVDLLRQSNLNVVY